jgi:hypothetical protein
MGKFSDRVIVPVAFATVSVFLALFVALAIIG